MLAGCSPSDPVAEPVIVTSTSTTTTAAIDTTTTTIDPEAADRAEIEDTITGFYGYYYEVGIIEGTPGLDKLATSPIYERMQGLATELASTGHTVGEGGYGSRVIELTIAGDTASAVVCVLDGGILLDAAGNNVTPGTDVALIVDVELLRTADGWRLTASTEGRGEQSCDL